jgi:pimeloyl-ACP methyl ester carboxylesterase
MAAWDPGLLAILEKQFKLILFDNRGVGFSTDTATTPLTISQMADDASQLVKALGYQKAHVLGWSMGSRIAMDMALRHPEMVQTLILCAPNPGGKHQAPRPTNAYQHMTSRNVSEEEVLSLIFPNTLEGRKSAAAFVTRLTTAMIRKKVPDDLKVSQETIERQVRALQLWDEDNQVFDNLRHIKAPTLVAGGLEDSLDNPKNVQLIASQIPFAWSAYFAGAGHNFLSQDYQAFADLILLFNTSANPSQL